MEETLVAIINALNGNEKRQIKDGKSACHHSSSQWLLVTQFFDFRLLLSWHALKDKFPFSTVRKHTKTHNTSSAMVAMIFPSNQLIFWAFNFLFESQHICLNYKFKSLSRAKFVHSKKEHFSLVIDPRFSQFKVVCLMMQTQNMLCAIT